MAVFTLPCTACTISAEGRAQQFIIPPELVGGVAHTGVAIIQHITARKDGNSDGTNNKNDQSNFARGNAVTVAMLVG